MTTQGVGRVFDDGIPEGEHPSIRERLIVAPHWGRVHQQRLEQGRVLERDTLIGELRDGGNVTMLVCPLRSVFLGWLVREEERVSPGRPLAVLLSQNGED